MTRYTREIFMTVGRRCFNEKITDEGLIDKLSNIKIAVEKDYDDFVREKNERSKNWNKGKRSKGGRYNKRRYEPKVAPAMVNWRSYKEGKGKREFDFSKNLNSLLNKISGDNFYKIQDKIFETMKEPKDLFCTLEQLFSKAIRQKSYCQYYARLASNLDKIDTYKGSVRPAIFEYCQNLYKENSILSSDVEKKSYDELCKYFEYKQRFIGNFQFMGELYKNNLLDGAMIEDFWKILLEEIRAGGEYVESNSECLCKLLSTIGNSLESSYKNINDFKNKYIKPVEDFSKDKENFTPRIRFMFMDCAERKRWID